VALTAGVLYAREDMRVTRTMVTIGDAHYPVAGISGVRITSAPRAVSWAWACGVLFALLAVVSLVRFLVAVASLDGDAALDALFLLVVSLLPVAVAARLVTGRPVQVHTLWLRDAAGEVAAMTSHDVRVVGDVADAISRAAHARG
jgi:hypothetical protein